MTSKPFRPNAAQRRKVETLAADGLGEREIALVLGIARGTLRRHFARQLELGRLRVRAETLEALRAAAKAGSAAAIRILLQRLDLAEAADRVAAEPARSDARQRLGKKEAAQRAAETAGEGTDWGDDLMPPPGSKVN